MTPPTARTATPSGDAAPPARRASWWLPWLGAAVAGGLLYASFPPRPLWWLAPLAFALLGSVLRGRSTRWGFGAGLACGLGLFAPLLAWTGEFVGPGPWWGLALLQAGFVAAAGAGIAAVSRLPGWPLWAAGVWTAAEAARSRVPFGGFGWGRIGFGQPDGVFTPLAAVGGPALIGFAVALIGFGLAALLPDLAGTDRAAPTLPATGARFGFVVAPLVASLAALAVLDTDIHLAGRDAGTTTVAAVQGSVPRLGLDFNAQRRAVLDNHARRTEQLAADVAGGRVERPDVVIWPENSADIDPLRNPDARAVVDRAARTIGVPILVGAVLTPPDSPPTNTMIAWDPRSGPGQEHDKRRLQPFGEYVPYREFFGWFSPLVERSSQFMPGHGTGALDLAGIRVAVATCYEVIFDDLVRQSIRGGGQVLVVPANNATFGLTEMSEQQIAIDRVRAVEHGRTVIVAATSGISAIIAPNGQVLSRSGQFTADALTARVVLRSDTTPATRVGGAVETALVTVGAVGLLAAAAQAGTRARRRRAGKPVSAAAGGVPTTTAGRRRRTSDRPR